MPNRFDLDPNAIALYRFESALIDQDSLNSNHLTNAGGGVDPDYGDKQEGGSSGEFEEDTYDRLEIQASNLQSDFPASQPGSTDQYLSGAFWFNPETVPVGGELTGDARMIVGQWHHLSYHLRSWVLSFNNSGIKFTWNRSHEGGAGSYHRVWLAHTIETGKWYHIGFTIDCVYQNAKIRLWDDTEELVYETTYSGALVPANLFAEAGRYPYFRIGGLTTFGTGEWFDGLVDELVIFKDELTSFEIDQIRLGIYPWGLPSDPPALNLSISGEGESLLYRPIFAEPVYPGIEILEFKTDKIRPASANTPQRVALRTRPRQKFRLSYLAKDLSDRSLVEALLHHQMREKWGIPIWPERVRHIGVISAGASSINIDTRYSDWRADSFGVIYKSLTEREVIRIASKTDSSLILSVDVANAYTGTKYIMPMRFAYAIDPVQLIRREDDAALIDCFFSIIDNVELTGYTPDDTYDGYPVLLWGGKREGDLPRVFAADGQIADNYTGLLKLVTYSDFNQTRQTLMNQELTKEDIWEMRKFFHYVKGGQKAFLLPTWEDDLVLSRAAGDTDTELYIDYASLAVNMGANDLRDYLGFMNGSSLVICKITAIEEVTDSGVPAYMEEKITVNATPGFAMSAGTGVMFVDLVVLSDLIEMSWEEPNHVVCEVELLRVPE
jgi:hypothetical protein